ncbi:Uncharacterised protein [Vibrio cholerae]|nr:Uncharacterised protein [Vibrio cholerae]
MGCAYLLQTLCALDLISDKRYRFRKNAHQEA